MKKLLRTLLLAAALTALLCVSALAADSAVSNVTGNILTPKTAEGETITEKDGKYENAVKFDVNATGTQGSQYLLLVLRDQKVPTEQNIVYINQAAAGEDGNLAFTGSDAAYPMTMTSGTYYVYLVGDGKEFSKENPAASFTYEAGYTLGDVDGDGIVTATDALFALQMAVGLSQPDGSEWSAVQRLAAEVDGEIPVTATDASLILQAAVGLYDLTR